MKLWPFFPVTVIVWSLILLACSASPIKAGSGIASHHDDDSISLSIFKKNDSSFWQRQLNAVGFVNDEEDFRDNWPKLEFNWRLVLGTAVGFAGSALGSAGGIGGGGFYLAMLNLLLGFDAKTSTALSKAMVMGASISSSLFNIMERHPTDETRPVIDYSLAVLFQPLLLLGISIGVIFNVLLPEWLITVLLCILFAQISWGAFLKANKLSRQEVMLQKGQNCAPVPDVDYIALSSEAEPTKDALNELEPSSGKSIFWNKMIILLVTWIIFLVLQVAKMYVPTCSSIYWIINALQIPVAVGVTVYEAVNRAESPEAHSAESVEETGKLSGMWKYGMYALYGLGGGTVGGLLGVGGGAIMGPAFLELGLPPQVSSSTASFVMVFSSSLSVVEYWLLDRLPRDYTLYVVFVAMVASVFGQIVIKRIITSTGKGSLIVYCLAYCVLVSGVVLAGLGAARVYNTWISSGYMGFHSICSAV